MNPGTDKSSGSVPQSSGSVPPGSSGGWPPGGGDSSGSSSASSGSDPLPGFLEITAVVLVDDHRGRVTVRNTGGTPCVVNGVAPDFFGYSSVTPYPPVIVWPAGTPGSTQTFDCEAAWDIRGTGFTVTADTNSPTGVWPVA